MPIEMVDEFEIEYEGEMLPEKNGWGAYVTVYGPSHNPMHLNALYPKHHVLIETVFPTKPLAEVEARRVALELVQHHRRQS